MRSLEPSFDPDEFLRHLPGAPRRALMLDYDGTLAPFHVDPRRALPHPGVREVLQRVVAVPGTRVVIVSGRRLEDLQGPLAMLPHTEAWASHGWEWSSRGVVDRHVPCAAIRDALGRARSAIRPLVVPGIRLETKVASLALHWRGAREDLAARVHAAAVEAWEAMEDEGLALLPFDHGLEIRASGHDKADAVRATLASCGDGVCAYLGDDFTDEDAFRAIRPYGLGVLVGEKPRRTEARAWISKPEELLAFMERWAS